jgi:hypothetical protein
LTPIAFAKRFSMETRGSSVFMNCHADFRALVVAVADKGHGWCEWEESGNVREHEFMPLELESATRQS